MKLTFQQDDDTQPKPEPPAERRSGFWRARAQLSQAVGGVLSNSLGALNSLRTQGALPAAARSRAEPSTPSTPSTRASQHGLRLREVLERDRALVASQPLPSEPAQLSPEQASFLRSHEEGSRASTTRDAQEAEDREPAQHWSQQHWGPQHGDFEQADAEQDGGEQDRVTQEFAAQDVLAAEEALAAREVLVPRADAIAQAIADAIAETDHHDEQTQPIRLEPLVAASSVTVVAPKKSAPCQEPIRTRTMAKLLAAQGHRERALSIYDHLLIKDPSEPTLVAEAAALRCAVD